MDLVTRFAEIVQTGELSSPETVQRFAAASSEAALAIAKPNAMDEAFENLDLESQIWGMIDSLAQFGPYATLSTADKKQFHRAVAGNLQEALREPVEPEQLHAAKWLHTRSEARSTTVEKTRVVTELDLDGPLRQQREINKKDATNDHSVFKYIFDLTMTGDIKRAAAVAGETDNWALKSALESEKTTLLSQTLYSVSQQTSLDKYERGIYGFLSGDVASVLPLCRFWEARFVVYMNALVVSDWVEESEPHAPSQLAGLPLPPLERKSPQEIIAALDTTEGPRSTQSSQRFLRSLFAAVIAQSAGSFIQTQAQELERLVFKTTETSSVLTEDPALLRIIVHVLLILKDRESFRPETSDLLLTSYIESLISAKKINLVPGYVRYISESRQARTYGDILKSIEDPGQRGLQLRLAERFGVNIQESIRYAADSATKSLPSASPLSLNLELLPLPEMPEPTSSEKSMVATLGWLYEARMWDDAVKYVSVVTRDFLLTGRVRSLLFLNDAMPLKEIADRSLGPFAQERDDLYGAATIINVLQAIHDWDAFNVSKDATSASVASTLIERIFSTVSPVRELSAAYQDDIESEDGAILINYVPYLIFETVRAVRESSRIDKNNLTLAFDVPVLIANESDRMYRFFMKNGTLGRLVEECASLEMSNLDNIWE